MLFDPAANLLAVQARGGDVRIIAGEVPVGQICCDPEAFADITTLVAAKAPGVPPLDARARALLSLVWPATVPQARLVWGARIAACLRPLLGAATMEDLFDLVLSLIADVVGVPAPILRRVEARAAATARSCPDPVTRAAAPLALLQTAVAAVVRDRATSTVAPLPPTHPETVLDELLFWRGLGRDHVSLDEIAALVSALTAVAWDATHTMLPRLLAPAAVGPTSTAAGTTANAEPTRDAANAGSTRATSSVRPARAPADRPAWTELASGAAKLTSGAATLAPSAAELTSGAAKLASGTAERAALVDAAVRGGSPVIGWLRITTAAVLLDGARIPAGTRCLLLVDAADPADHRTRAPLQTLRWLSPGAPDGAGATFARLVGDALLATTAARQPLRPRPFLPNTATA